MQPRKTAINNVFHDSAAASGRARSEAAALKIRNAMVLIDLEIEANEGVYPGGKINQRELCRRANVHYQTLQQPGHKASLKLDVDAWINSKLDKNKTVRDNKKNALDRWEHWKAQHEKVATQICIYEVEFSEKNGRIAELEKMVASLEEEILHLRKSIVHPLSAIRKE